MDRTTPIGMLRYADDFFKAARCVDKIMGRERGYEILAPIPVLYLTGHSIELALKAYLLHCKVSLDDLKNRLRHDLIKCLKEAEKLNIEKYIKFEKIEIETLKHLNKLYVSKQLEYIKVGSKEYPIYGHIQSFCEKLLNNLGQLLKYKPKYNTHIR